MTLISEDIKSVALAIFKSWLSEGISKQVSKQVSTVSQSVEKNLLNTKFLQFHNYLMEGFRIDLKTFLDLAMLNQYRPTVKM